MCFIFWFLASAPVAAPCDSTVSSAGRTCYPSTHTLSLLHGTLFAAPRKSNTTYHILPPAHTFLLSINGVSDRLHRDNGD